MKRNLLVLLLALMTSAPMLADVVINETNFPDENFRNWLLNNTDPLACNLPNKHLGTYGINGYGKDNKLTTAELSNIRWLRLRNLGIKNLKGIEHFTSLIDLDLFGNPIETIDLSNNTELQFLVLNGVFNSLDVSKLTKLTYLGINNTHITSLDVSELTNLRGLHTTGCMIASLDLSKNTLLTNLEVSGIESLDLSHQANLAHLSITMSPMEEIDLSAKNSLHQVWIYNNDNLTSVILPTNPTGLKQLYIVDNPLLNSIDISACSALEGLEINRSGISSIDISNNTALKGLSCIGNRMIELDVSHNPNLLTLNCDSNLLTSLDLSQNTQLRGLQCNNNKLTELDLSKNQNLVDIGYFSMRFTSLQDIYAIVQCPCGAGESYTGSSSMVSQSNLSPQILSKDYTAIDGRGKLGVQCNTNDGVLTSYGNYTALTDEGNNYIMVADETVDGKTDVHAYRDTVRYSYNTGYTGDYDEAKTMAVKIGTSAHGMYVHPETKTTEYDNSYNGFYWGTLYLEFPARIPDGVQCYYAKSLDVNENLANLTEVTGTIPANTAVIVKAPNEPKFFAFNESFNESDVSLDAPDDNIMRGTIEVLPVAKRSVLTLGFNVSNQDGEEGQFGFWDYVGTRINPFRAYVPKSNLPAGAKGGFSLLFPGDDTNGIARLTNDSAVQDGTWLTLSGVRLNGKPTAKGIYVNGGKKVVIK